MCHPAPGPRCSAHAYTEYIHALRAYEQSTDADEVLRRGAILAEKQALYDSTPRGQRALDRARNRETDFGKVLEYQKRLEDGRQLRKDQLAAYHAVAGSKRSIVKAQLLENGVTGRYEHAAGIAYHYLLAHRNDLTADIVAPDTISVEVDGQSYKVFVMPQKYQATWGSARQENGRYLMPTSAAMAQLLNVEAQAPKLSAQGQAVVANWFTDLLRDRGYALFAGVNTLTEQVHIGLIDELVGFITVGLRVQAKPRGTTPYRGEPARIRAAMRDTVFESGKVLVLPNGDIVVTDVGQQPRSLCTLGDAFLAWQDDQDRYLVRKRHTSSTVDLIVKTRHRHPEFDDGVSTQAIALLGDALV